MGQAADEAIQQLSVAIEQDLQPGRQPTEALVTGAVHQDVVVSMDMLNSDPQAQDGLSVLGLDSLSIQDSLGLEVGLSGRTDHGIPWPGPEHNTGRFRSVLDFILGPNRSDPIWRLRFLASFNLVVFTMFVIFFLTGYPHGVHTTYQRVMLLTSVGIPVVVAVISLFVSCWVASDRDGWSNWITGLLVTNVRMLGGALLVIYLVLQLKTGN